MIKINLLPGAKKARGRGAAGAVSAVGAYVAAATARIRDPFLGAAVASVVVAALFVGGTYTRQTARASSLAERQETATADSARYAVILRERTSALAQRDSVSRQLSIIRAIDNNRFVWPHVMDEVSRALPPYTWLTSLQQTSAPQLAAQAKTDSAERDTAAKADSAAPPALKFRLVGNTVDIQALTRFMKDLEASPFVENVALNKSDLALVDGKEVTQFQLDCEYQTPDLAAIRTVPVSLQVR